MDTATEDTAAPPPSVEQSRYEADLAFIAAPRPPGSAHWQAVQDLCADRFAALGYTVERHDYGSGVNVIGTLTGTSAPAERVVLSAHYDHVTGCAGADDNGSGVAGLLEAARVLAAPHPRTLVVACWDEEERGLVGSGAWAARAVERSEDVVVVYDFEMIGYRSEAPNSQTLPVGLDLLFPDAAAAVAANAYRGDFVAVIGDASAASSRAMTALSAGGDAVGLPVVGLQLPEGLEKSFAVSDLRRSDHAQFWDRDIPALMITDTSEFRYSGYHCADGPDTPDRLDPAFATQVVAATAASVRALLAP
ncbi:MAG: M20/M25/M40 family metallo-hydrolase [Deltaproteobacteria bacterium]|nr:MAG: M20/M25/M40 family metallo-hydrolase [Deltaproteobacteria bacterium]